jgi:hypothetical protein
MFTRTLTEISEFSITREEWKGGGVGMMGTPEPA